MAAISRRLLSKILLLMLLALLAFLFLLPIAWWINFAAKGNASLTIGHTLREIWIPNQFLFIENLRKAFALYPMAKFFLNSLIVSSIATAFELMISSIAGFSFAKYKFAGRRIIFSAILALLMIPQIVLVIPLFEVVVSLNMVNTYRALVLPFLVSPFGIFMMRQFCSSIPNDYIEAARVEGVGEFRLFLTIILPFLKSAFALLGIFTFLRQWDTLLWPLITLSKQVMYTLAVGVSLLQTNVQVPYNALYAVTLLFSIPVLVVYLLFQKLIIESLTMSGIKG